MSRGRKKKADEPAAVIPFRPRPGVGDLRTERFEFVDAHRGVMARLAWGRYEVLCTEWPGTLLAMLRADVLGPDAREEAEFLNAEAVAPAPRPSPEPWVPPALRCGVPGCGWPGTACPYHPKAKPTVPPPIVQTGQDLRDEALDQVERNADPVWLAKAELAVASLAQTGADFTTDDAWAALDRDGVERPREPRAMGAVFNNARRSGLIEPTGVWVQSASSVNHARDLRVWRGVRG